MSAIFLYGLVALFDGVSIGSGDFGHLPRLNFLAMLLCIAGLVAVRACWLCSRIMRGIPCLASKHGSAVRRLVELMY